MEIKSFLKLLKQKKEFPTNDSEIYKLNSVVLSSTYNEVPWGVREIFATEVASINFGCKFENNSCVKERNEPSPAFFIPAKSLHVNYCCSRCFQTIGNLTTLTNNQDELQIIAGLFDSEAEGFWKQNVGCTLPIRYRSNMCLTGRCAYLQQQKLSKEDLIKIYRLINMKNILKRTKKNV